MFNISEDKKKKRKHRHYNSKAMHIKNVEKTLEEVKHIRPGVEPPENKEVINIYFKEKRKDRVWQKRRRLKG